MARKYFVIAYGGGGKPVPIMDGSDEGITDEIKLFESPKKAEEMAENQPLCKARGYEIFAWETED